MSNLYILTSDFIRLDNNARFFVFCTKMLVPSLINLHYEEKSFF